MANRSPRDPGRYGEFTGRAQIGGVPDFAVDTGSGARALASVAGSLSSRLKTLADQAIARDKDAAGLSYADRVGAGYLQARAAETISEERRGPPSRAQVNAPAAIRDTIVAAAQKYGVDPAAMLKIAEIESSFQPGAKNPRSSAGGLFQFVDGTAAQYGLADRYDPAQASDAAARLARDNAAHLRKVLGREPSAAELYLAHQQGAGGAAKLLANPNARAVDVLGRDKVLLNGGTETMLARDFAGKWLSRANGGGAVTARSTLPQLSDQPLQLRRDGTIAGEAFDAAARRAYAWRVEEGLSTDLANAFQETGENPAAFAQRLGEIRDHYLKDASFADPELREAFERSFAGRSRAYAMNVAAKHEQRLKAEEQAAVSDGLAARGLDLERQAYALGANPEGDSILADQLERSSRAVDAAVEAGTLTPAQGADNKAKMARLAASARVQGVFDNLATPGEKEQFALSLLEDWQTGEGPLAKLPFATVKSLSQTLYNAARAEGNRSNGAARVEKARIKKLLDDDVASIGQTGKPLDLAEAGTDLDTIAAALTPAEYEKWQADREDANKVYQAVSGMDLLPGDQILTQLEALAPEPGAPGYADAEKVYKVAEKRAEKILKERAKDPLGAAHSAGLIELAPLDPGSVDSMEASLAARRDQARQLSQVWGEPVPLFRPSEVKEAKAAMKSADPMTHGMAMMQADFLAGETSLDNVRLTFGEAAVDALQDWRATLRHMTPDEVTAQLKQRADPAWGARVKPLRDKGMREARKIAPEEIVAGLDTNVWYDAAAPLDPETQRMMVTDFERLAADRYAATGDMDTARDQAIERMQRTWGVTSVYGGSDASELPLADYAEGRPEPRGGRGGRVMPFPPEHHYPAINGSHQWLADELSAFAQARGTDPRNLSLVADDKTRAAADRGERPGYLLAVVDPETGLSDLMRDDQGRVLRHFFDPQAAQAQAMEAARKAHRPATPLLGIEEAIIAPSYQPLLAPASEAEMRQRRKETEDAWAVRVQERLRKRQQVKALFDEKRP